MVKINKLDDIDQKKLMDLFYMRGRSISTPKFTQTIITHLENEHSESEIHQCECGDIFFIEKKGIEKLRNELKSDELKCFKCLGFKENKIDSQYFLRLSKIRQLLENRVYNHKKNAVEFTTENFDELRKNARGMFATGSVDEFYYGYNNFVDIFSKTPLNEDYFKIIEVIYDEALKNNTNLFEEFSKIFDPELFDASSLNTFLVKQSIERSSQEYFDKKFFGYDFNELAKIQMVDFEKETVNKKMTLHKNLLEEGKFYLDTLINLINVVEGRMIEKDPFAKLRLPKTSPSGKGKKIEGIKDRIELFQYHFAGDKLYSLLTKIYDTQLRNDEGHNQYEINVEEKIIHSIRYARDVTFEDLERKIELMQSLHSFMNKVYHSKYIESKKSLIKNLGIEEVGFTYEDQINIDGDIFPNGDCLPVITLFQYWDFASYENEERYFPTLELLPKSDFSILIQIIEGTPVMRKYDSNIEMWFNQLITQGAYKISLNTIAPLFPWFNDKAIVSIPINQLPEVNIMEIHEKTINLSKTTIKRISNVVLSN